MAALQACNILITGANRGLGLEMVRQLAEMPCSGRQIFACCREADPAKVEALQELAKRHNKVIHVIHLDVTDLGSIKEAAQRVGLLLGNGGLNLLVNNAGVVSLGTLMTSTDAEMQRTFNTNVMGPFNITKEFMPYLQTAARASGRPGMSCDKAAVINISSKAGSIESAFKITPSFRILPYSISKAGLNMLTVCAAVEFKQEEILFLTIHPGWARTDMGGAGGELDPKESVEGMLKVMSGLSESDHGGFLDYTGKILPW